MNIGIIECGKTREEWLEHGEFGTWFPSFLRRAGKPFSYAVFNAVDKNLPQDPGCCDAWLLTGSPASAYEDMPWQSELTVFLENVIDRQPVVGICYGHQHLHHMLNGRVEKVSHWGVGIQHYDLRELPDWLPEDIAVESRDGFNLIALHQDQVTQLASGTKVLAASPSCSAAVTTIGCNILTFQPHPEMAPEFAAEVYDFERHRIGSETTDHALQSLSGPRDNTLAARWIMAFLKHRLMILTEEIDQ